MRIVEPASKLRTTELLANYFGISYAERSVYRLLPKLLDHKNAIENAAYQTAKAHFSLSSTTMDFGMLNRHSVCRKQTLRPAPSFIMSMRPSEHMF